MTTTSNNDIARALFLTLKDKSSAEQSAIFPKIIQFLFRKRLLSKSSEILSRLDKMINSEKGRVVVKVSSKNKLSEKIKKELEQTLLKRYSAKEIRLIESLDEKLLGGFRVEVNDEVVDLTIKNKIEKLQEYLIESL